VNVTLESPSRTYPWPADARDQSRLRIGPAEPLKKEPRAMTTVSGAAAVLPNPFLQRHLPGVSAGAARLREEVELLNGQVNSRLVDAILINGESGAGKSHLAKVFAAHRNWVVSRSTGETSDLSLDGRLRGFQSIHLPSLPDTLVESELFGHVKGSFTGADRARTGLLAGEFTDILLDEIGDATPLLQAKLLDVVQTKTFRKVGANPDDAPQETSARFIFATNCDLEELVRKKKFREDLYWRLMVYRVGLPALREDSDRIIPLALAIHGKFKADLGGVAAIAGEVFPDLTKADLEWAAGHRWPGNIRELEHSIKRFIVEHGQRPLKEIVAEIERSSLLTASASDGIQATMERRLEAALALGGAAPGTLEELIKGVSNEARRAVYDWYKRTSPSKEDLERLFPGMQHNSVISRISEWKGVGR
jgi:transcriptional regulator with GAF, ATPase, and Fis domain